MRSSLLIAAHNEGEHGSKLTCILLLVVVICALPAALALAAEGEADRTVEQPAERAGTGESSPPAEDVEEAIIQHLRSRGAWLMRDELIVFHRSDRELAPEDWERLSKLRSLTKLTLRGDRITDDHLRYLAGLESLERLAIFGTQVTAEGVKRLAELESLWRLRLAGRTINEDFLKEVGKLHSLEMLALHGPEITDDLLEHIRDLQRLKFLHLGDAAVTDEGLLHVKHLPQLERLNLQGTRVTDDGMVKHLAEMESLRILIHPDRYVTHQRTLELRERLPPLIDIPFFDIAP